MGHLGGYPAASSQPSRDPTSNSLSSWHKPTSPPASSNSVTGQLPTWHTVLPRPPQLQSHHWLPSSHLFFPERPAESGRSAPDGLLLTGPLKAPRSSQFPVLSLARQAKVPHVWPQPATPASPPHLTSSLLQIGRASCRERVSSPV